MASGTKWDLYASNEEAWLAMLHDCAHAERSIVLEQFIFVDDDFGRKLMNVCAERASHGVKVRFLWDAAGSFSFFGSDIAAELKEKGIEVLFWKTLVPSYFKVSSIRSWFLRNHRRTLVVDGRIGYTGSICVSDALRNWRDTNVRVEGRVAADMENAFERMWHRAKKSKKLPPRKPSGDPDFRYLTNYPAPGRRHIYSTIIKAFKNARHYAYVTTPYFVPTHRLFNAIREAAERGVDVRLIIPERSNHYPALDIGARSFFSPLLEAGARIFLYPSVDGQIIHSKTIVVDGDWSTVGSMNLDSVSLLYNFEANIVSNDTRFAEELAAHFVRDMNASKEVSLEEWESRLFVEKIPETLIKLVRKFL